MQKQDGQDSDDRQPQDKAFAKGLMILEALTRSDGSSGVSELAKEFSLTKSNVHRILQTLHAYGFVRKDGKNRYSPSLRYWELGYEVWGRSRVGQAALHSADGLAVQSGCLVHVTVADGDDLIFFERIGTPISHPLRQIWPTGARVPVWQLIPEWRDFVAFQVAFIAALPQAEFDSRASELKHYCSAEAGLDFGALIGRVEFARDYGFARNVGEGLTDVRGTACAFVDEGGVPQGVLSTISDLDKLPDERLPQVGRLTTLYAHSISHALGYRNVN
ncbi:MAG: IclR family transcriptional regulator [Bosea sp. (in: a-proteobacteria)]|nr:IclR family transcriptional regulator [Bosea sp. (in: a-proteobacteria)]